MIFFTCSAEAFWRRRKRLLVTSLLLIGATLNIDAMYKSPKNGQYYIKGRRGSLSAAEVKQLLANTETLLTETIDLIPHPTTPVLDDPASNNPIEQQTLDQIIAEVQKLGQQQQEQKNQDLQNPEPYINLDMLNQNFNSNLPILDQEENQSSPSCIKLIAASWAELWQWCWNSKSKQ